MNYTITTAKTLFNYDSADDTAISTALTNAIPGAKAQLRQIIGANEFLRYNNNTNSFTATSKATDNKTFTYANHILKVSDMVTLDNKSYIIASVTDDTFTIDTAYTGSALIFTINTLSDYELLFANCLVYQFTFTGRELLYKQILSDNQQYGDGAISPAGYSRQEDKISLLRKQILENMEIILSPYDLIINNSAVQGMVIR